MKTIHVFSLFVLVAIAQLFIPSQMIFHQERILETGTAFKFKTRPVDPSDPFKGKYIFLNYEINSIETTDSTWMRGEDIYLTITNDSLGFAMAEAVSRDIPQTSDFVKTQVDWYDKAQEKLRFSFAFDEFYMNETKAYDAEVAHRVAQRDSDQNNTYALIFVKDGEAVLENVFINEVPIAEYVE